jgi:hypothetical protein
MKTELLHTIGRVERVDLPSWQIEGIEAKIDTGAYSSSVHCHHIEEIEKNGESHVQFYLFDPEHEGYNERLIVLPIFDKREVKSSNGQSSFRIFIKTHIMLFGSSFEIELSLADRSEMKFPLLIGRKFLKGRFLVDVSRKNLSLKNRTM